MTTLTKIKNHLVRADCSFLLVFVVGSSIVRKYSMCLNSNFLIRKSANILFLDTIALLFLARGKPPTHNAID